VGTGFPSGFATKKQMKRVRVARIHGPHGVRGQVKLQIFLEDPGTLAGFERLEDTAGHPVRLSLEGRSGAGFIARIEGVTSREAVKVTDLFVTRAALPATEEDEFYEADLVGLAVLDETGEALGQVVALADFGAGPLIEVKPAAGGATVFLPFTEAVVPKVDLKAGEIRVALPPGLWPGRA
jgi:16S rRNA processing protein RimM